MVELLRHLVFRHISDKINYHALDIFIYLCGYIHSIHLHNYVFTPLFKIIIIVIKSVLCLMEDAPCLSRMHPSSYYLPVIFFLGGGGGGEHCRHHVWTVGQRVDQPCIIYSVF